MRHIFIGDIHGCIRELEVLVAAIVPRAADQVFLLGDLIDRGPDSVAVVRACLDRGFKAVRGNHEEMVLASLLTGAEPSEPCARASVEAFSNHPDLVDFLMGLPYSITIPEINVVAVHAAVDINQPAWSARYLAPEIATTGRFVEETEFGWRYMELLEASPGDRLWWEEWLGPQTIIFAHTPFVGNRPLIAPYAVGLDTGCVYGGTLTAAIIDGENWTYAFKRSAGKYCQPDPLIYKHLR